MEKLEWFSVYDKKPPLEKDVLVWVKDKYTLDYFDVARIHSYKDKPYMWDGNFVDTKYDLVQAWAFLPSRSEMNICLKQNENA